VATCNISSLVEQAAANGFLNLPEDLSIGIELQLWQNFGGGTASVDSLVAQACANGFLCLSETETVSNAIELQLICNFSGG
jgi:hypothetical protein